MKDPVYFRPIAKVFSEVVLAFGKYGKAHLIQSAFQNVFTADSKEYYKDVLEKLPELFPYLIPKEDEDIKEDLKFKEFIIKRIKKLWSENSTWRELATLIKVISRTQEFLALNSYVNYYVDEFFTHIMKGNNEIQKLSIEGICRLLISCQDLVKRNETFEKLNQLRYGGYYDRKRFIIFCSFAVEFFAPSLLEKFKLFENYITLSEDKVTNIKLSYLKSYIKIWTYATNTIIRNNITETLKKLKDDENAEVKKSSMKVFDYFVKNKTDIIKGDEDRMKNNKLKEEQECDLQTKKDIQEEIKQEEFTLFKPQSKSDYRKSATPILKMHPKAVNASKGSSTTLNGSNKKTMTLQQGKGKVQKTDDNERANNKTNGRSSKFNPNGHVGKPLVSKRKK